ncbi:hypothetical protein MSC49_42370 (plasmid) [Methylosinus sp. C49]|uniref:putative sugar O-methyltransferase n=1 Tax=Methylosinus sp. C49 TaxID=2699395 RepID=UPI001366EB44|nr:putative sugar O-methyltransferase [Methylosinus sp. C49]BBU64302.1 hypothetical protein MSC49_42370 [Methylosinus sp. C49]
MIYANDCLVRFKSVLERIRDSFIHEESNAFSEVSPIWKTLFAHRSPAVEFNDFAVFLSDGASVIDGAAAKCLDVAEKERLARYHADYIRAEELQRNPLSLVGTPTIFEFEGLACNTAYLENLSLFLDVEELIKPLLGWQGLRILEIGAGYGGLASLLIRAGVAKSYTIIDLPANLQFGAFYLTQNFPEIPFRVVSSSGELPPDDFAGLTFVTAGNIRGLDAQTFDLAINTDSMGEMPAQAAKAYVSWVASHLRPGGCFFTKNGHRRSSTGVQRASEYGYEQMDVLTLEPMKTPSTLFADHSHRLVLTPRSFEQPNVQWKYFDGLCELYALGLHDELKPISRAFANSAWSEEQKRFLDEVKAFTEIRDFSRKIAIFGEFQDNDLRVSVTYLKGLCAFFCTRAVAATYLEEYLSGASSHVAEATALFLLSQMGHARLSGPFRCGTRTQFMVEELQRLGSYPLGLARVAYSLRNDVLRKKLSGISGYKPSKLLKMKNLAFNLREGKGVSFERH